MKREQSIDPDVLERIVEGRITERMLPSTDPASPDVARFLERARYAFLRSETLGTLTRDEKNMIRAGLMDEQSVTRERLKEAADNWAQGLEDGMDRLAHDTDDVRWYALRNSLDQRYAKDILSPVAPANLSAYDRAFVAAVVKKVGINTAPRRSPTYIDNAGSIHVPEPKPPREGTRAPATRYPSEFAPSPPRPQPKGVQFELKPGEVGKPKGDGPRDLSTIRAEKTRLGKQETALVNEIRGSGIPREQHPKWPQYEEMQKRMTALTKEESAADFAKRRDSRMAKLSGEPGAKALPGSRDNPPSPTTAAAAPGTAFVFKPSDEELAHLTNLIEHGDWTSTPGARTGAKAILNQLLRGESPTDKQFALLQRVFESTGKQPQLATATAGAALPSGRKVPRPASSAPGEIMEFGTGARGLTDAERGMAHQTATTSVGAQPPLSKELAPRSRMSFTQLVSQIANVPRSVMTMGDLSAAGRQAIIVAPRHPVLWGKAFWAQMKAFKDPAAAEELMRAIKEHPDYHWLKDRVELTGGTGAHEEPFQSPILEHVPGAGKLYKASDRAFSAMTNKVRWDYAYDTLATWRKDGVTFTPKLLDDLGHYVNNLTGRGTLPKFMANHSATFNAIFFAPSFTASRLELIGDVVRPGQSWEIRKRAMQDLGAFVATGIGVLAAMKYIGGMVVGTDPCSSDFGKYVFKGQHHDFWAGYGPIARFVAQEGCSAVGATNRDWSGAFTRFLRTKEAPLPGLATDIHTGSDLGGNAVDRAAFEHLDTQNPLYKLTSMLALQDAIDAYKQGGWKGAALAVPAVVLGESIGSYTTKAQADQALIENAGVKGGLANGDIKQIVALRDSDQKVRDAWGTDNSSTLAKSVRARVGEELTKAGLPDKNAALKTILASTDASPASDRAWKRDLQQELQGAGVTLDGIETLSGGKDSSTDLRKRYVEKVAPQLVARDRISLQDAKDTADTYFDKIPVIKDFNDTSAEATKNWWSQHPDWLLTAYDAGVTTLSKAEREIYDKERGKQLAGVH